MLRFLYISILTLLTSLQANAGAYSIFSVAGEALADTAFSDIKNTGSRYVPVKNGRSWGILDVRSGMAIDCVYEDIVPNELHPQLFAGKQNGLWGVFNASGQVLLDFEYDEIKSFDDEVAAVSSDFYWTLVSYEEGVVVEGEYENVSPITGHAAIWFEKGNRWNLFSREGVQISVESFKRVEDTGRLRMVSNGWNETGVIDSITGKRVVPLAYNKVRVVNSNLVEVGKCERPYNGFGPAPRPHEFVYGIYSISHQKEVVPCAFEIVTVKENHIYALLKGYGKRYSYYTDTGKVIDPSKLEDTAGLRELDATQSEKLNLLKETFRSVTPAGGGAFVVRNSENEYGLVNLDQHFIFPFGLFKDIIPVGGESYALRQRSNHWGIMDRSSRWVASPGKFFKEVRSLSSDDHYFPFVFFIKNDGTDVYNAAGDLVLETETEPYRVSGFSREDLVYRTHDDEKGSVVYFKFSKDGAFEQLEHASVTDLWAVPMKNEEGLYGLKRVDGEVLQPAEYKSVRLFGFGDAAYYLAE